MGTKLNKVPNTEKELNELLQSIYLTAKNNYDNRVQSNFTGILEIIASEPNIVTAIHKVKSNKGSLTAGIDQEEINDYLNLGYDQVLEMVREKIYDYQSNKVRRIWIPKSGKSDKRLLGIPTIIDRIIQECIRRVLEPIAEAQFFEHSYGW